MSRDEAIQIVYLLNEEQLEILRRFLYLLTSLEEKRKEDQTPDPEGTGSN